VISRAAKHRTAEKKRLSSREDVGGHDISRFGCAVGGGGGGGTGATKYVTSSRVGNASVRIKRYNYLRSLQERPPARMTVAQLRRCPPVNLLFERPWMSHLYPLSLSERQLPCCVRLPEGTVPVVAL